MVALVFALNAIASMAPPGDLGPLEVLGFVAAFAIAMPVVGILRMLLLVHPLMREDCQHDRRHRRRRLRIHHTEPAVLAAPAAKGSPTCSTWVAI